MKTYQTLYYHMVRSVDAALTHFDRGKPLLARRVLEQALEEVEDAVLDQDIIPEKDDNAPPEA